MILGRLYHSIVMLSPRIEVAMRCFYWNNVKYFQKYRSEATINPENSSSQPADFKKITEYLYENGVRKHDIMIVHSSYGALSGTGLSAEDVIDSLYSLVNEGGTLAMPAIRTFPEEEQSDYLLNYIDNEMDGITTLYDVYKSSVSSGLLPFTLMRYDDAEISKFPLNPLTAIGAEAKAMMEHNIDGVLPSAHGPNSAWAYCAERNAWNVGIGVDVKDYLTIFHVAQETREWPIKDWFFERNFIVKKGKLEIPLKINERKHKWTKYFAEDHFYNDLQKAGVLISSIIDGIPVFLCRSKSLLDFINSQRNPSYPYFVPKNNR